MCGEIPPTLAFPCRQNRRFDRIQSVIGSPSACHIVPDSAAIGHELRQIGVISHLLRALLPCQRVPRCPWNDTTRTARDTRLHESFYKNQNKAMPK
jgi:hypothetical protein